MLHQAEAGTPCGKGETGRGHPAPDRRHGELHHGEQHRAAPLHRAGGEDDVQRVEKAAADGQRVAQAEAQPAVDRDQRHADYAHQRRRDVEPVRPLLGEEPPHEGHDDAVGRREEGVLAGRGVLEAEGLQRVGREERRAEAEALQEVLPVEQAQLLYADERHEQRRAGEAEREHPQESRPMPRFWVFAIGYITCPFSCAVTRRGASASSRRRPGRLSL